MPRPRYYLDTDTYGRTRIVFGDPFAYSSYYSTTTTTTTPTTTTSTTTGAPATCDMTSLPATILVTGNLPGTAKFGGFGACQPIAAGGGSVWSGLLYNDYPSVPLNRSPNPCTWIRSLAEETTNEWGGKLIIGGFGVLLQFTSRWQLDIGTNTTPGFPFSNVRWFKDTGSNPLGTYYADPLGCSPLAAPVVVS